MDIEQLTLDEKLKGVHVRLTSQLTEVKTGTRSFTNTHRLTYFDALWHDYRLAALVTIVATVFSALMGIRQMRKEVHS